MSKSTVTMCPCGTSFKHSINEWSGVFPLSELDGWIEFYRKEMKKRPEVYGPDFKALTVFRATEVSK